MLKKGVINYVKIPETLYGTEYFMMRLDIEWFSSVLNGNQNELKWIRINVDMAVIHSEKWINILSLLDLKGWTLMVLPSCMPRFVF